MNTIIITESPVARKLMERLINSHPVLRDRQIEYRTTEGRYASIAKARTIMLLRHEPIVLVADADRDDLEDEEQYPVLKGLIAQGGPPSQWRVIFFRPSTEVLLFHDDALRRALLPVEPTEEQLRRARRRPKRVLAELFAQAGEKKWTQALVRRLEQVEPSVLWTTKKFKRLESFLLRKTQAQPTIPKSTAQEAAPAD
jgi:hypothetical protein